MAAPPPLDELVSQRRDVLAWWASGEHQIHPAPWHPMEERMIHRYFSEQPFFDWTTKNGLLLQQSSTSRERHELVHSRHAFEAALRQNPGTEYVIVGEPQQVPGAGASAGQKSGVWVIRKQDRIRQERSGDKDNPFPKTETLATYFIVGENVYQAPSVADVVGNRLLAATASLSKFFDKAASLPSFSPTTGHTYLPQTQANKPTGTASVAGSPSRSREGSLAPVGGGPDTQSLRSTSLAPDSSQHGGASSTSTSTNAAAQDARLMMQSLQTSIQFSDEYADENPLLGEPGAFKFTSSAAAVVKKRKADEDAAASAAIALAAAKAKAAAAASSSRPMTPKPGAEKEKEKVASPPAVFTDAKAAAGQTAAMMAEKQRKEEKKRRRKSRPNNNNATAAAQSPTTPASATSTLAPLSAS